MENGRSKSMKYNFDDLLNPQSNICKQAIRRTGTAACLTNISSKRLKIITKLTEDVKLAPILYHGTCSENAQSLVEKGWQPRSGMQGGNMGQPRYLYLSTGYEDALWFANEKGCDTVVELHNVPVDHLIVDPEDGYYASVEEELKSTPFPGKVALTKSLSADHFKMRK